VRNGRYQHNIQSATQPAKVLRLSSANSTCQCNITAQQQPHQRTSDHSKALTSTKYPFLGPDSRICEAFKDPAGQPAGVTSFASTPSRAVRWYILPYCTYTSSVAFTGCT
jgi:hypothetical protein